MIDLDEIFKPGALTVMQHRHDDGCPTMKTQNMDDCICGEVELELVSLDSDEAIGAYCDEHFGEIH